MRSIGCPETSITTILRYVTSQKKEELIYTPTKAWNGAGQGRIKLFDRVGVFMADIIFTLLSLLLCL